MTAQPDISVVIPARDEIIALAPLLEEVGHALAGHTFEVIVIDDGSTDGTPHAVAALQARHPWLCALRNDSPCGQSASIRRGVRAARGALVVTLDGDGQNPPDQIPALLAPFARPGSAARTSFQFSSAGRRPKAGGSAPAGAHGPSTLGALYQAWSSRR